MAPSVCRIFVARTLRARWPVALILLLPIQLFGQSVETRVVCFTELDDKHRQELTQKLQRITGWSDLEFDRGGALRKGARQPSGGSPSARSLVANAISGDRTIAIEDVSRSTDVVFSRVLPARWKDTDSSNGEVFVIQIDFADFQHVTGDRIALEAFDVGWVVLHELDHIVNDSVDASYNNQIGDCEDHINLMRREINLPERGNYFFTFVPTASDSVFGRRLVRLEFQEGTSKKYWLLWDASLVGGLGQKQLASLR